MEADEHRGAEFRRSGTDRPVALVDAHAHLDHYDDEEGFGVGDALDEIDEHRILTLAVSMDADSFRRTVEIADGRPWIVPSFGIHPWEAPAWVDRLDEIRELLRQTPIIGEVGLDCRFVEDPMLYPAQRQVFEAVLEAASEDNKPVNLHTAGAEDQVAEALEHHGVERAVVHWYSGPLDAMDHLLELGALFTVGPEALRSQKIREIAERIPDDRLLTETDNPGAWAWLRKRWGEVPEPGRPSLILDVVEALARIRDTTPEAVADAVRRNLLDLFGDDPGLREAAELLRRG